MVVILIIGILSAIAIPVFMNQKRAANDVAVETDVRTAVLAVENWMVKNSQSVTPPEVNYLGPTIGQYGGEPFNVSKGVKISIVNYGRTTGTEIGTYVIYAYHLDGDRYKECNKLCYSSKEGGYSNNVNNNTCTG